MTEALSPASRCTAVDQRQSVLAAAPHSEDEAGASPTPEPSEWGIALAELIASRASAMLTVIIASQRHRLATEKGINDLNELLESSGRDNLVGWWSIEHSDRAWRQVRTGVSKSDTKSCHRQECVIGVTKNA